MLWRQKPATTIRTSQSRSQNPVAYAHTPSPKRRYFIKCGASIAAILLVASACQAQNTRADQSPETPFLRAMNKYPGLLPESGQLIVKLQQNIRGPSARNASRVFPLLPESPVS